MDKIKEIVVGTNNEGKYKEICELLPNQVKKYSLKEFDILTSNDLTVVSVQPPKEEEEPVVEEEEVLLDEEGVPIEEGEAEGDEKPVAEGEDAPQDKEADSE